MESEIATVETEVRRSRVRGWFAAIFLASLLMSLACGLIMPRVLAAPGQVSYNPAWLVTLSLAFGLVAICTVPLAWRWVYRRGR